VNETPAIPGTGGLLLIGYGNELRGDDGAGPKIAQAVAKWKLPAVRAHVCHQLTPELAPLVAAADRVVFVDAATGSSEVQIRKIESARSGEIMTHVVDPRALLRLASMLYGNCPLALSITIPAENFGFGEELSGACSAGMEAALDRIRAMAA
jgi:hydrogenase maturation protease